MRCSLTDCNSTYEKNSNVGISFHKFPTDPDLLKKWMLTFETHGLVTIAASPMYICSLHFQQKLINYKQNNTPYLRRNAVPSEFNFQKEIQSTQQLVNVNNTLSEYQKINNDNNLFSVNQTCRTCLKTDQMIMRNMFENNDSIDEKDINIVEELLFMKLQISREDGLPQRICEECINNLKHLNTFRIKCERSQEILQQHFKISSSNSKPSSLTSSSLLYIHDPLAPASTMSTDNSFKNQLSNVDSGFEFINIENDEHNKFQPDIVIKIENDNYELKSDKISPNNNKLNNITDDYNKTDRGIIKNELFENTINTGDSADYDDCTKILQSTDKQTNCKGIRFQCDICQKYFRSDNLLQIHRNRSHTEHSCPHCSLKYPNVNKLKYHLKSHNKQFKCDICGQSFAHKHRLKNHKRSHTDLRPYLCYICGKGFKMDTCLATHMKLHSGVRHTCSICNKDFSTSDSLVSHMGIHTGIRPYICNICSKDFLTKFALKAHMRKHAATCKSTSSTSTIKNTKNLIIYPFACDLCNKRFKVPSSLTLHMRMHSEERKYECSICGMAYKLATHLSIHINGVHLKLKPYKCDACDKSFFQSSEKIVHMRTHTGEKPFKCSHCDKNFHGVKLLRRHMRIHSDEQRYKCEICNLTFTTYKKLASHTAKSHKQGI